MLASLLIAEGIGVGYASFKGPGTRIWVQDLMFRAQKGLGSVGNMEIDYTWIKSAYSRRSLEKSLGTPVVPFCPFYFGVSLLKLNSGKRVPLLLMVYWGT